VICEEGTEFVLNIIQMNLTATVCANTVQCVIQHNRHLAMAGQ